MDTLAFHLDHRLGPASDPRAAAAVGEILVRPCFASITRVARNVKDRDTGHRPKTADAIAEALLASDSDAAVLDSGRQGELIASARIWTGRHIKSYDEPKPLLASYVLVPYDARERDALIDAFLDLAAALHALAGFATIERDHSRAQNAALSAAPAETDVSDFPRRAQERKGHYWYDKRIEAEISGPDWGTILGPEHLKRIKADPSVFPLIRDAGASKVVFLSNDPADALSEAFESRLDAARKAMAPVLMDVSKVPVS
jgi:hypothetical protein